MALTMTYKGFVGKVEIDEEESELHGVVINANSMITFVGKTVAQTRKALADSVEVYLKYCAEKGIEPDKPYSGKILVRIEPQLHAKLVVGAARRDESLNDLVAGALERYADSLPELQEA
jgi:predicted HicB family RNase H-like nuclease